jgi:septal ring factor EnvC (AmiA/AmiB activator)
MANRAVRPRGESAATIDRSASVSADVLEHSAGLSCLRGALAEIHASHRDCEQFFAEVFEQFDLLSGELGARAQQVAQSALQDRRQESAADSRRAQLQEQIQQMTRQQALLEQERTQLESELEAVRNRAAETAELLAEQKRLSVQQQSVWADELKRLRCLLEGMSRRLAEVLPAADAPRPEAGRKGAVQHVPKAAADPALDSVVAQFEILQKDLARRRASA